jgi:hypothetical protein
MHAGSFILDGERVDIRRTPPDGFADPVYLDPITQYFNGGLYRMWPSERYLARGGKRLHRDVWSTAFGAIPKGCHIHHRDNDTLNNALANLECVPASEHLSETWHRTKAGTTRHFGDSAREKAAEWHRSDEGRLWHKRQAERQQNWKKWERAPKACEQCGSEFQALLRNNGFAQRFCCANCKARHYRQRKAAG